MTKSDRIILVTGSTDGIGLETAKQLSMMGYHTIVHGRDPDRVEKTLAHIRTSVKNPILTGLPGDLSSLQQVRTMSEQLFSLISRLDVLINNAGVIMKQYAISEDGYEQTFAVNHLAHFYLTGLILPLLKRSDRSRIVNISSGAHSNRLNIQDLLDPGLFDPMGAYSRSKLCNILFTYRLSGLISNGSITVNAQHPGVINTKMLRSLWGSVGAPIKKGVENECYLAVSEAVGDITGAYFNGQVRTGSASVSYDPDLQTALWEFSLELLKRAGFKDPYSI